MSTILDQLDLFDIFKELIDDNLHNSIKIILNIPEDEEFVYDDILYYPTFCLDEHSVKVLKSLNIRHKSYSDKFLRLDLDTVEDTGASWQEYLAYLKINEAKLVNYKEIL